jgi:hypothetical protein
MAKEYIDREALKRDLIDNRGFYPSIVKAAIENAPAADVVEVVRCRDCKHAIVNERHPNKPLLCCKTKMWGTTTPNWYCAGGAKMDGRDGKI